jgi:hypothetical protein
MMDKIAGLERKLKTAMRYCETEEETHRNNVDFTTDKGYMYYSKEMTLIPDRKGAAITSAERKKDMYKSQKDSAIAKLKTEVEMLRRKIEQKENEIGILEALIENNNNIVEKELRDIESKYDLQVEEYVLKQNTIRESLSYPTGKTYLRNKELVGILQDEIAKTRREWTDIMEKELERTRANAIAQMERDKAEADRKDREERQQAMILKYAADTAKQQAKAARWKLLDEKIRQEQEDEEWVEKEMEKLEMEKLNSIKE